MIRWWEVRKISRCPHVNVRPIYGDEIIQAGFMRNHCMDCGKLLDGPVSIAINRQRIAESGHAVTET